MTEPFRAREADHLKPGEFVRVVAINRATGYMGTQRVQLASVNAEADADLDDSRGLAVIVPDLALRTQVVRVGDNLTSAEHFYIHVSGTAKDESPDFDGGDLDPPYENRPNKLTPFLVPLYDEDKHWQTYNEYRRLQKEFDTSTDPNAIDPDKPHQSDYYAWNYRPEYQFSQFELELHEINRVQNAGTPEEDKTNILDLTTPMLSNTDDLIEFLYSLIGSDFERLTPIDGEQELILSLGEEETAITLGEDRTITFNNLAHLASLAPEDYLSMRLYTNNDAGNILWEYAFEYLNIRAMVDADDDVDVNDVILVSADDAEVELSADLIGYAHRAEDKKYDVQIMWAVTNGGALEKIFDTNRDYAIFDNTLRTSTVAGATYDVSAKLVSTTNDPATSIALKFRVVPGVPASIDVETSGLVSIEGKGVVEVKATVRDAHGNLVDDSSAVSVGTDGALEFVNPPGGLQQGVLTLQLKGSEYAETAHLTINAGNVSQEVPIEVRPLNVAINNLPASMDVNASYQGQIQVTDVDGAPVEGVTVELYSELGRVATAQVSTNAQGLADILYVAPQRPGNGAIKARLGMQPAVEYAISVDYPQGQKPALDTTEALVVGDQAAPGSFEFVRYDNAVITIPYAVSGQLRLNGNSGETLDVQLGDIYEPNRLTLAAVWMNTVEVGGGVTDETGYLTLDSKGVTVANGSPQQGGRSLSFSEGHIAAEHASRLQLSDNFSVSMALRPQEGGGTLVNLANGLKISLGEDRTIKAQLNTSAGSVEISSAPVSLANWHRIAVRVRAGQLTLWVDGASQSEAISAAPQYSPISITDDEGNQNNYELVVGQDYQGQLSSLKWYQLASGPLATFSNGQETLSVTLDSQGQQTVPVLSTGNLRSFGSNLPMQSIAISTPTERRNINLISLALFGDISRISIAGNLVASAPPIDESVISYLPGQQHSINPAYLSAMGYLIPSAHAYEISAADILSIVASLVGLDSLEVIWDQLTNLATGQEVDIVAFSLAVLDVLTLFPPAAPLKLVTGPAKLAIKTLNLVNPKAAKYLAGVIKRIYNQAKNRDFTLVYQGIAFFIIAADMMTDEEALEGLKAIGETINSTEDFLGWVEFLSLADPEILLSIAAQIDEHQPQFASNPLAGLIPNAHAGVASGFGKLFGKVAKELKPQLQAQRKEAAQILKQIRKIVTEKGDDVAEQAAKMRKLVFRKNFIKGAFNAVKRGGLPKLRNWLLGYNGQRISPLTLMVVSAYLEEEVFAGRLFPESEHPFDHARNLSSLNTLFIKAVPEAFNGKTISDAHGSSYQLLQLAFVHATGNKVLGIEVTRNVPVFKSKADALADDQKWAGTNPYLRKVDIVTGTALHADETWWEVKSWRSVSKTNREIKQNLRNWTFLEGKDSGSGAKIAVFEGDDAEARGQPHKQMCLDRIALENGAFLPTPEQDAKNLDYDRSSPPPISIKSAPWQFHQFTAGKNKDIVNPTKPILETALVKDPRKDGGAFDSQSVGDGTAKGMINLGAAQQLMEVLKNRGFDLAEDALQDLVPVLE